MTATERHGLAQRRHEGFTIRTIAQMPTNFLANTRGKLVIDIGRQPAKDTQTPAFLMSMPLPPGIATFCHVDQSLRYRVSRGRWMLLRGLAR